ncbi:hypothetical protein V8E36_009346 [Tilletia maclaganii]
MKGSLLRGLVDAAAVAANLTKVAIEATSAASAASATCSAHRHAARQKPPPRPWPTQRHRQQTQEPTSAGHSYVATSAASPSLQSASMPSPVVSHNTPEGHRPAATQEPPAISASSTPTSPPQQPTFVISTPSSEPPPASAPSPLHTTSLETAAEPAHGSLERTLTPAPAPENPQSPTVSDPSPPPSPPASSPSPPPLASDDKYDPETAPRAAPLRSAKVPSSRLGRLLHYGSLGAGLAWGAAGQYLSGGSSSSSSAQQGGGSSPFMGEANLRRLVDKLSTMRGAALKLGQFMSIQDSNMLPPELEEVLLRVQNSANYMPEWQMEKVMREDLGPDWRTHFETFNPVPFAAASIGQVHSATLASTHPAATSSGLVPGSKVAVKIQFPGIKQSIASDLSYLTTLLTASALLPKGLFLQKTIATMRGELEDECDYVREAEMGRRFARLLEAHRAESRIQGVMEFAVPTVVDELCTGRVLTTEMMRGRPLTQASRYSQERRNQIATSILRLCLQELFQFRLMQTDPNWSNFLLNERTNTLELLDFGATREYSPTFIDQWFALLSAAVRGDREACLEWSHRIGYLTGEESQPMLDAHLSSMLLLAEPFAASSPSPYPFTNQTITARVRSHIPVMLRERRTPPPKETYSLNRKLSGAFLLCARLGAEVRCKEVWEEVAGAFRPSSSSSSSFSAAGSSGSGVRATRAMHTLAHSFPTSHGLATRGMSQGGTTLLAHPRVRARLDALDRGVGHARRHVSSSTSSASSPQPAVDEAPSQGTGPSRRLDLRSQWSRIPPTQSRQGALARLELPADALGVDASPTAKSLSSPAASASSTPPGPVLGPRPEAEKRMKIALGEAEGVSPSAEEGSGDGKTVESTAGGNTASVAPVVQPVLIRGILIPRKPPPPGPEDCCMSGCVHCAYDIYADSIQDYIAELGVAREKLLALPLSEEEWGVAVEMGIKRVSPTSSSSADAAAAEAVDAAVKNVEDPTLRAFLEIERKLNKKQKMQRREERRAAKREAEARDAAAAAAAAAAAGAGAGAGGATAGNGRAAV